MQMEGENITCVKTSGEGIMCNGTEYLPNAVILFPTPWFWIYLAIYVALVLVAGLMSGLTMGLLSLDVMSLKILSTNGKPQEQIYAKKILPLVKRHHLLLVTLLLSNAAAVESMPLFLDKISNPITAIIVSVTAVLIFGEVVPQALCTRYGLAIGATMSPLVWFLMGLTFIISWPIAKLLDCLLGKNHSTFFRRAELGALVDLHQDQNNANEEPLTDDEVLVIKGALSMRDKTVEQICTLIGSVFSLDINGVMDFDTMDIIVANGRSRVPIRDGSMDNLLGLVLVKNLIKIDPEDNLPIRDVFANHQRPLLSVQADTQLYDALNLFQMGKSHMFVVVKKREGVSNKTTSLLSMEDEVVGVVTLEDVIEELIQEEIMDETDVSESMQKQIKVVKARVARQSISASSGKSVPFTTSTSDPLDDNTDDTQPLLLSNDH
uniref:DUF21 domain-containing protein At4g33700-like n=1 Tax=Phallusia mammillata TaxID=59560 RepID=A0A6F9D9H2_9ASCI|nr:DUF21 domain-containing protein At4g33700-like [Phallusia mammillata]